jgi:hypothetical protein
MVPALSFGISFHLSTVGFSQTDDATLSWMISGAVNEYKRHDAHANVAQRHPPGLVIVLTLVRPNHSAAPFKPRCIGKRNAMLRQIRGIFGRIKRHIHD